MNYTRKMASNLLEDLNRRTFPGAYPYEEHSEYDDNWVNEVGRQVDRHRDSGNPRTTYPPNPQSRDSYYYDNDGRRRYYREYDPYRNANPVREATYGTARTGVTAARGATDMAADAVVGASRTTSDILSLRPLKALVTAGEYIGHTAVDAVKWGLAVPSTALGAAAATTAETGNVIMRPEWWHRECSVCNVCNSCNRLYGPHDPECVRKCDFCDQCVNRRSAAGKHVFSDSHYERHLFPEEYSNDDSNVNDNFGGNSNSLQAQAQENASRPELAFCPRARDCMGCGSCMNLAGGSEDTDLSDACSMKKACGCAQCSIIREHKAKMKEFEALEEKLAGAKLEDAPLENASMVDTNKAGGVMKPTLQCLQQDDGTSVCTSHRMLGQGDRQVQVKTDSGDSLTGKSITLTAKGCHNKYGHRDGCTCPKCVAVKCGCGPKRGYPPAGRKHKSYGCHSGCGSRNYPQSRRREYMGNDDYEVEYDPPLSGGKTFCCETRPDPKENSCNCGRTVRLDSRSAYGKESSNDYGREHYDETGEGKTGMSFSYYNPPLAGGRCVVCKSAPKLGEDCRGCETTIYDPPANL